MSIEKAQYELGVIKEYSGDAVVVDVNEHEYTIKLNEYQSEIVEMMLLDSDMEYVSFDTKNNKLILEEDVFHMNEFENEELQGDLSYGVNSKGNAE